MNMFNTIGKFIGKSTQHMVAGYHEGVELAKATKGEVVDSKTDECSEPFHNHHDGCPVCDMPNAMSVEV